MRGSRKFSQGGGGGGGRGGRAAHDRGASCADPENFLREGVACQPNSQKGSDGKFQHGKKQ